MISQPRAEETCWLLANGLGGYASTSAAFSVTRNDQGLLIAAETPNQRFNLVHRLSEELTAPQGGTKELELVFSTGPSSKTGEEILRGSAERQCALPERSGPQDPVARELARSADAFIANRTSAGDKTIVADYPIHAGSGSNQVIWLT